MRKARIFEIRYPNPTKRWLVKGYRQAEPNAKWNTTNGIWQFAKNSKLPKRKDYMNTAITTNFDLLESARKCADSAVLQLLDLIQEIAGQAEFFRQRAGEYRSLRKVVFNFAVRLSLLSGLFVPKSSKLWKELPTSVLNHVTKEEQLVAQWSELFGWNDLISAVEWRYAVRSHLGLIKPKGEKETEAKTEGTELLLKDNQLLREEVSEKDKAISTLSREKAETVSALKEMEEQAKSWESISRQAWKDIDAAETSFFHSIFPKGCILLRESEFKAISEQIRILEDMVASLKVKRKKK